MRLTLDAPHTGARLETMDDFYIIHSDKDAPHTGARLETPDEDQQVEVQIRCPPHGGTT